MVYRINVASQIKENVGKKFGPYYLHYFAFEVPQADSKLARQVLADIKQRFPEPEFNVTCTKWETVGTDFE